MSRSRSPTIEAIRAETAPGCCIACDQPLPPPKPNRKPHTTTCGRKECRAQYDKWWQTDKRAGQLLPTSYGVPVLPPAPEGQTEDLLRQPGVSP